LKQAKENLSKIIGKKNPLTKLPFPFAFPIHI